MLEFFCKAIDRMWDVCFVCVVGFKPQGVGSLLHTVERITTFNLLFPAIGSANSLKFQIEELTGRVGLPASTCQAISERNIVGGTPEFNWAAEEVEAVAVVKLQVFEKYGRIINRSWYA